MCHDETHPVSALSVLPHGCLHVPEPKGAGRRQNHSTGSGCHQRQQHTRTVDGECGVAVQEAIVDGGSSGKHINYHN